ncbi:MAG TPA: DUF6130 family protein, partial [Novosphingobium sp.]
MNTRIMMILAALAVTALAAEVAAQTASQVKGPTPFLPIANEPSPRLFVDPPLPDALARGVVIVQYRLENIRIVPVFGAAAQDVSPRAGHLHVTVDNLPWHWADAGGTNTLVVQGLPAGEHSLLVELADVEHHIFPGQATTL